MKVKVLGIQFVDYVSRKTGNPVKGVTLHSCYPDGQVKGEAVDSIFVSDNLGLDFLYQILPGDEVDICLLYTSPSPRDRQKSRMPSSA